MKLSPVFWSAFLAGMTGPALMYAPPSPYYSYLSGSSVAETFGVVGVYLLHSAGTYAEGEHAAEAADTVRGPEASV